MVTTTGRETQSAGRPAPRAGSELSTRQLTVLSVTVVSGLVAASLAAYVLSLPNVLRGVHGNDDGVYLGATLRLLHGTLPYRDFAYLHPPGLPLLLSPFVALAHVGGDRTAMVVVRCVTAAVTGATAAMAAFLLRSRGAAAMATTGVALACFPLAATVDHTVLLDPYLAFFCLLGALLVFDARGLFSSRRWRLFAGGAAFGFATSIKLWALLPLVALAAVVLVRKGRGRRVVPLGLGTVIGFAVPTAPFVVLAPGSFFHDVIVTQAVRGTSGVAALSVGQRLLMITGLGGLPGIHAGTALAVACLAVLGVLAVASLATWARPPALDLFILVAAGVTIAGLCVSREFYTFYGYFPGVFVTLVMGLVVGTAGDLLADFLRSARSWKKVR